MASSKAVAPAPADLRGEVKSTKITDAPSEGWEDLFRILRASTGVDFSSYRRSFVARRVGRRVQVLRLPNFKAYLSRLAQDPLERETLHDELLLTVTSFFRDPEAFRFLERHVLPVLLKNRAPESPLRIWVAGCSSGEEAYSMAMVVLECRSRLRRKVGCQIFATDIREDVIARARAGVYPSTIDRSVSRHRLDRFFTPSPAGFRVNSPLRDLCIYSKHDLTKDPPFPRMDLVSCRNVLIFMEPFLQERVLRSLYYALKPGGYLMLGPYENPLSIQPLLGVVTPKWKIFERRRPEQDATAFPRISERPPVPTRAERPEP